MKKNIFFQKLATRLPISEHSCQLSIPSWNIIWKTKAKAIHEMFHCPHLHKLMQLLLLLSLSSGCFLTYFLSRVVRRKIAYWDKILEFFFFFSLFHFNFTLIPWLCHWFVYLILGSLSTEMQMLFCKKTHKLAGVWPLFIEELNLYLVQP